MKKFLISCLLMCTTSMMSLSQELTYELLCGETTFDEMNTPMSKVFLFFNGEKFEVGECLSCNELDREDFLMFGIPEKCHTAVGGWYAGSGDYFYALKSERKEAIEIYFGWQDEEQEGDSFHWELHRVVKIK